MSSPIISIVIATYNDRLTIKDLVLSLKDQSADPKDYEVLVVNNKSTDETRALALEGIGDSKNIFLIDENNQGVSYARNRGIDEAKGEYVAFMDGDARSTKDWIETALKIINEQKPDAFGGPIYPFYLTKKPEWFKDEYEKRILIEESGWLPKNKYLSGANMAFRKDLLLEVGKFNPEGGMKANNLRYGEDTIMVKKFHEEGKKIYYDLELIVDHLVPEKKMNILYFLGGHFRKGMSSFEVSNEFNQVEKEDIKRFASAKHIYSALDNIFNNKLPRFYDKYNKQEDSKSSEQVVVEDIAPEIAGLGYYYQAYLEKEKENERSLNSKVRRLIYRIRNKLRI